MFANKHHFDVMRFTLLQEGELVAFMEAFLADDQGRVSLKDMTSLLSTLDTFDADHLVYLVELLNRHPELITARILRITLKHSDMSVRLAMHRLLISVPVDAIQDSWLTACESISPLTHDVSDLPALLRQRLSEQR